MFLGVYDWDCLVISPGVLAALTVQLDLCTGLLPCSLFIRGVGGGELMRSGNGGIRCLAKAGCTFLGVDALHVNCTDVEGSDAASGLLELGGPLAELWISGSSFEGCKSSTDGSAVLAISGGAATNITIVNSTFRNCASKGHGGVVRAVGCNVTITGSFFLICSAGGGGGAMSFETCPVISISRTVFENCTAFGDGGSLDGTGRGILIFIEKSSFLFSASIGAGGAVSVKEGILFVENVGFAYCTSASGGGALQISGTGSIIKISETFFSRCLCANDGGAVQAYGGSALWVNACSFEQTRSGGAGGAVSAVGSNLSLAWSSFSRCSAANGGGAVFAGGLVIYGASSVQGGFIIVTFSDFNECAASGFGGALWQLHRNRVGSTDPNPEGPCHGPQS